MGAALKAAEAAAGDPAYVVGGAVRDAVLKRPIKDLDLAYGGDCLAFSEAIAKKLDGKLVVLDDETKIFRIALREPMGALQQIDVAAIIGRTIEEDLRRRDFTINAAALPLGGGAPIDPRGALRDLGRRVVRADEPGVFDDDPLRLLRAFRLAGQLGFKLEPATVKAVQKRAALIRRPAPERVRAELMAIASLPDASRWFRGLEAAGLLTSVIKELAPAASCAVEYYGRGGVMRHTLDALERMDALLADLRIGFGRLARPIAPYTKDKAAILRIAVLLHDVAKPATARQIDGRLRFFEHEARGAKMAQAILKRLRFSSGEVETVSAWVANHLRPGNLAANARITDKAVYRFFKDLGDKGIGQLLVCWADHASYLSPSQLKKALPLVSKDPHAFRLQSVRSADIRKTLRHLQVLYYLLDQFIRRPERAAPKRILDGNDVMKALGIKPGPEVGEWLDKLAEAQAEGKVVDRASALSFLKSARI